MEQIYSHIELNERCEIYRLHADGISRRRIAARLGRSPSTISRELRRNALPKAGYKPASADRMAMVLRGLLRVLRGQFTLLSITGTVLRVLRGITGTVYFTQKNKEVTQYLLICENARGGEHDPIFPRGKPVMSPYRLSKVNCHRNRHRNPDDGSPLPPNETGNPTT